MPLRTSSDDLVVQVHADLATHRDHHGLAGHLLHTDQPQITRLKVRNQIRRNALNPWFCPDNLFQRGPTAFQSGLLVVFFIFCQLIDLIVDRG